MWEVSVPTPNRAAVTVEGLPVDWDKQAGHLANVCDRSLDLLRLLCRCGPLTFPIAAELLPDLPLPPLLRIPAGLPTAGTDHRSVRICLKRLVKSGRAVASKVINDAEGPLRVYTPQLDHREVRRLDRSVDRQGLQGVAPVRDVASPLWLHTLAGNRYAADLFATQRCVPDAPMWCDSTGWGHEPVYRTAKRQRRVERADLGFSFRYVPGAPKKYSQLRLRHLVEVDRGTHPVEVLTAKQRLFRGVDHLSGGEVTFPMWCFDEWSHRLAAGHLWTRLAALVEQVGAPRTQNAVQADARTLVTWPSAAAQGWAVPFPKLTTMLPDLLSHSKPADLLLSRLRVGLLPWANKGNKEPT